MLDDSRRLAREDAPSSAAARVILGFENVQRYPHGHRCTATLREARNVLAQRRSRRVVLVLSPVSLTEVNSDGCSSHVNINGSHPGRQIPWVRSRRGEEAPQSEETGHYSTRRGEEAQRDSLQTTLRGPACPATGRLEEPEWMGDCKL